MLTGCPNIHGQEVIDSLRAETLSIELGKGGRNCTETLRGFLHCGLFTKDHRTGLALSLNVEMFSKAIGCGFDSVEESLEIGSGQEALSLHQHFSGLKLKTE